MCESRRDDYFHLPITYDIALPSEIKPNNDRPVKRYLIMVDLKIKTSVFVVASFDVVLA